MMNAITELHRKAGYTHYINYEVFREITDLWCSTRLPIIASSEEEARLMADRLQSRSLDVRNATIEKI